MRRAARRLRLFLAGRRNLRAARRRHPDVSWWTWTEYDETDYVLEIAAHYWGDLT